MMAVLSVGATLVNAEVGEMSFELISLYGIKCSMLCSSLLICDTFAAFIATQRSFQGVKENKKRLR